MIVKGNENNEEDVLTLSCSNTQNMASSLMENPNSETYDNSNKLDFKLITPFESKEEDDIELDEYHLEPNVETQSETGNKNLKYCTLPKEFFSNSDIPPPLVCKSWLSLVYRKIKKKESDLGNVSSEDNDSTEDSMPLSELKNALRKVDDVESKEELIIENVNERVRPKRSSTKAIKTYKKLIDSCDSDVDSIDSNPDDEILRETKTERRSKSKKTDILIINRKRGRPKKKDKPASTMEQEEMMDDIVQSNIDEWLEPDNNDGSDLEIPWHQETREKNDTSPGNQEHDYFSVEKGNEKLNESISDSGEKKGKKKGFVAKIEKVEGKTKSAYLCTECDKSFSAASTLKYHMRIHEGTLIKCPECDKGFTTNYLLKCHMRIHNGDLFMCHKCGRGFTTAELLKVHSRGHTGDRPFTCHICGKAFPSASNLRQHKETHDNVRKYLCFQCGASFSQKRCLDGHMLSHGEKNHICTVCGKLWARKSDLTEHMRVHTGSKPYSCNMCPQKFTQASSLRRHQIVHMETKPIPCLTCGKMFKCEDYFKRHVKKHEKEGEQSLNSANE